jgi:CDP-paratose synthetase
MRILLTGASGFLGSALAQQLILKGFELALLLRPTSTLDRLNELKDASVISRYSSETDIDLIVNHFKPDVVIHTACSYGRKHESMVQVSDANVRFGLFILQSLMRSGRSVTFINTGTALSPQVSLYALSKKQFSEWGSAFAMQSDKKLRFVNIELQHMYGPRDDASKFTTQVLHACQRNEPILELTSGEQKRDFIYIDDVVSAYVVITELREQLETAVNIQVGSGEAPTVREFVESVHHLTKSTTHLQFGSLPYRPNEAMLCQANITQMKALGWLPSFDLKSGIKKMIELEFYS